MTISVMAAVEITMPETLTPAAGTRTASPAHEHHTDEDAFFCRECLRARNASEAQAMLKLLGLILQTTASIAHSYLTWHPEGCRCVGCRYYWLAGEFADEVETIRRVATAFTRTIGSEIDLDDGPGGATFGDDLRELAKLADEADRLLDIEHPEEEETPAVVVEAR